MSEFDGGAGSHWLFYNNTKPSVIFNEDALAKVIINLVTNRKQDVETLSLAFFTLNGGKDFSQRLHNWDFDTANDPRLAGWNGLFSYRPADRVRMLPIMIPGGSSPRVVEDWLRKQELYKFLTKNANKLLVDSLTLWRREVS